ncbi:unnamed protein product, partial [Meganyctiphanes norvegica]
TFYLSSSLAAKMHSFVAFTILLLVQNANLIQGDPVGRDFEALGYGPEPLALPCPMEEDIAPCMCHYNAYDHTMDLNCSLVSGEADLNRVFQAYFPFPSFKKLSILDNIHLKVISDGAFGNVTFETVEITSGAVRSVDANAFSKSAATLTSLNLASNHISEFSFETLTSFSVLDSLILRHNELTMIPPLTMSKLIDLDLSENPIQALPENVFNGIPRIHHIYMDKTNIQELAKQLFGSNRDLYDISFGGSQIRHLLKDSLRINGSPNLHFIELYDNQINNIEAGAIVGASNVEILLMNNAIETLPETVFKPLLASNNVLRLEGNPLGCGCDVAWLVTDSSFHHLVSDATCYDGEVLINLDPTFYEDFC